MIEIQNLNKAFGDILALNDVSLTVPEGGIFGLVGTNGAGKSTLLRILSGIYRQDAGTVRVDGETLYENPVRKQDVFYISDDAYYFLASSMEDMLAYYRCLYPAFSDTVFTGLCSAFGLDPKRRLATFSKGMTRQAFLVFAFASGAKYLLLDETFDGLDPVMRLAVKRLLATGAADRRVTSIVASHSLRELEDIADHVGLLHRGGLVMDMEVDAIQSGMRKVQCAFAQPPERAWFESLNLLTFETRGRLCTMVAEGDEAELLSRIRAREPQFVEIIPLTLEELFISKMEGIGYEIKDLFV